MQHDVAQPQEDVAPVTTSAASCVDPAQSRVAGVMNDVLDDVATTAAAGAGQGFHPRLHGGRGEHLQGSVRTAPCNPCLVALADPIGLHLGLGLERGAIAIVDARGDAKDDEQRRPDRSEPQPDFDR